MKLNKLYLGVVFLFLAIFISGCSREKVDMNVLSDDNQFHYQNRDLKFAIDLPADFIYYQTQRKNEANYIDVEFFVPTTDTDYFQEVSGYAKPIVVRVFKQDYWNKLENDSAEFDVEFNALVGDSDEIFSGKGDYVYVVKYWGVIPGDWQEKWSNEMKDKISRSFKAN